MFFFDKGNKFKKQKYFNKPQPQNAIKHILYLGKKDNLAKD